MKSKELVKLKVDKKQILDEKEMDRIYGSGNSQVRYIPDEYIQAKILSEKGLDINGKRNY